MQTFLPHASFARSARALDSRRLGKQRVEVFQILRALVWPTYAWKRHPAVAMWRGFTRALVGYGEAVCAEWVHRGHRDSVAGQLRAYTGPEPTTWEYLRAEGLLPPWLGSPGLHTSHRAALLDKDPAHYTAELGFAGPFTDYVWPEPVFPRWPLRRPDPHRPLPPGEAAALAGVAASDLAGPIGDALRRVHRGGETEVAAAHPSVGRPATRGATEYPAGHEAIGYPAIRTVSGTAGILAAGFTTPGLTAWYVAGPALPRHDPAPAPPVPPPPWNGPPSQARPPTADDEAAMTAEAADPGQFRFFRTGQRLPDPGRFGLVVLDGGRPRTLPPGAAVLRIHPGS
ncbi:hypothetical protein SAMN05421810_10850 [Amycolatopsis arida]|uniref:Cytoplasmic protein n=1 Tax=Amycolatopsis arida TaxID=587909 RepID=A0A1I5YXU4_9PSEU|nr:MSMEG_6728 family protein [Amycolatopsis arida]TDX89963.1 hypothetical protein CLV69_10850 [Amycolatopsis arida]SFQ49012.1 hypothetical protein SAMN05421810_10850 [Amycolatopsis arida]